MINIPDPAHIATALVRVLEAAALAAVATDSMTAVRLALLASELRRGVVR